MESQPNKNRKRNVIKYFFIPASLILFNVFLILVFPSCYFDSKRCTEFSEILSNYWIIPSNLVSILIIFGYIAYRSVFYKKNNSQETKEVINNI